mmetsp:Transcript_31519/g.45922  ORF Transcript_31519/g.45922 Transcript_31519/m.45922 type:complete len:2273 (-) Transcript_31519:792-7610(-)
MRIIDIMDHLPNDPEEQSDRETASQSSLATIRTTNQPDWIMPFSLPRVLWDVIVFMAIWYNSVVTPVRLFIMTGDYTPKGLINADIAFDVLFVVDTMVHFYLPYVDGETGQTITDLKRIRKKYFGSVTFYINVIACIPILKIPLSAIFTSEQQHLLVTNFNIMRMIRVLHFQSQFRELKTFCSHSGPVNESLFRMGVILFFTFLMMLVLGCAYFGLSLAEISDICPSSDDFAAVIPGTETWVAHDFVITDVMDPNVCETIKPKVQCDQCPQFLFFARSVYFLMQTLFTIGYGDSVKPPASGEAEMIFACICLLFGVFMYGLIIANMTSVLSNLDVVGMRFRQEMDTLVGWMSSMSLPSALKDRVHLLFIYIYRKQYGMLEKDIFADLPPLLAQDLANVRLGLISKIPFFSPSLRNELFLHRVAAALICRVHTPGSYILFHMERQRELVIILDGRADIVLRESPDAIGTLNQGDYMGDYQLLFGTINQVGLRSPDFTEVLVLTYEKFKNVFDNRDSAEYGIETGGLDFRSSTDEGVLKTIENSSKNMKKLAASVNTMANKQQSNKFKEMMSKTTVVDKRRFRVFPDSKLHVYWDIFCIFSIMYYSIVCPIRLASAYRSSTVRSYFHYGFLLDYILDIMHLADIFLRMNVYSFVSYESGKHEIIHDSSQIRNHYFSSKQIKVDILTSIPYDVLSLWIGYPIFFRAVKMIRIMQLPRVVSLLRNHLETCMNILMSEAYLSSSIMFLLTILVIVWSSSGWNAIREEEKTYQSVYWAFTTLTTVGYGDLTPENLNQTVYALLVGTAGVTFCAGIIANVTSFFHNAEVSEDSIEHKHNCVKWFMEQHNIPLEHIGRVEQYFGYLITEKESYNEDFLLNEAIPDHIKNSILIHMNQSMVTNCELFADCDHGFLRSIILSMECLIVGPQYMVIKEKCPVEGMYLVKKGVVNLFVVNDDGSLKSVKTIEANESFAERSLLENWKQSPFVAKSMSDCVLWFLSKIQFCRLLRDNPQARDIIFNSSTPIASGRRSSIRADNLMRDVEKIQRRKNIYVHPDSHFVKAWFGLVLLVLFYNLTVIPFRIAFMENHNISAKWIGLDYFGDFTLIMDTFLRARLLAFYDDGHIVTNQDRIWENYKSSGWMKLHLLSFLPFEISTMLVSTLCPYWKLQVWSLFRLNKLFRVLEIRYFFNLVETSLGQAGVKVPKNQLKVGKLMMLILLSAHIVGCIFFGLANYNQHKNVGINDRQTNWANDEGLLLSQPRCSGVPVEMNTIMEQYIASLYWSMATLTTVGYGDVSVNLDSLPEVAFATCILVIGTSIYTYVIALLEEIVSELDVTSSLHKQKMSDLVNYFQMHGIPDEIKGKIIAYYENLWRTQRGVKGEKLFQYMPRHLRVDVKYEMTFALIKDTFFFKECNSDFLYSIADSLILEVYLPGEILFVTGERCNLLYYLYTGDVNLLTPKGVKFKTMTRCTIAESSFFCRTPHPCTAQAANNCEIFQLHEVDFWSNIRDKGLCDGFITYLETHIASLQKSRNSIVKMVENFSSSKMNKMLVIERTTNIPCGVILPDSKTRQSWDIVALFVALAYAFNIPWQISFAQGSVGLDWIILDGILDLFFILDVYARCRHFAIVKDGFLITSRAEFQELYFARSFVPDLISIMPVSVLGWICGVDARTYAFMRLVQFSRIRSIGAYLANLVETIHARTKITISTGYLRIFQIFLLVLIFCHWFACIFHLIGDEESSAGNGWLLADSLLEESINARYLRALYWAFYTATTVGFGSVPVVTIGERIFAMFVMLVGAVICDAGITAVLTSLISRLDVQAGTNSRRICCSKQFMLSYSVPNELQNRILQFYEYADTELSNIDDASILSDLSTSLKSSILANFCFRPLRDCHAFHTFSDGGIRTIVNSMQPYLAVPGEYISQISKVCRAIYVLQRGRLVYTNERGFKGNLPSGAVIGHVVTKAEVETVGYPNKTCSLEFTSISGLRIKTGNPFIIAKHGGCAYCTNVKRTSDWCERVMMSLPDGSDEISITVKIWQKNCAHVTVGIARVSLTDDMAGKMHQFELKDDQGKTAGFVKARITISPLSEEEIAGRLHKLSVFADSYCHLYRLDIYDLHAIKEYFAPQNSSVESISRILRDNSSDKNYCSSLQTSKKMSESNICLANDDVDEEIGLKNTLEGNVGKKNYLLTGKKLSGQRKKTASVSPIGRPTNLTRRKRNARFLEPYTIEEPCHSEDQEVRTSQPSSTEHDWDHLVRMPGLNIHRKSYKQARKRISFFSEWGVD